MIFGAKTQNPTIKNHLMQIRKQRKQKLENFETDKENPTTKNDL